MNKLQRGDPGDWVSSGLHGGVYCTSKHQQHYLFKCDLTPYLPRHGDLNGFWEPRHRAALFD